MPVVPPGSVPGTVPEMQDHSRTWLQRQTSHWRDWPPERLLAAKQRTGTRISVVSPARDEERTVGRVVGALRQALLIDTPLVDEIIVIDSDSAGGTGRAAGQAGATVHRARDIAPELGAYPGKGEALWKSLLVTQGDLLLFVDADLTRWGPHFVSGLAGPLLLGDPSSSRPQVQLVKGFYEQVRTERDGSTSTEGGRATELVARPLLSLWWPQLALMAAELIMVAEARRDHPEPPGTSCTSSPGITARCGRGRAPSRATSGRPWSRWRPAQACSEAEARVKAA